jgi:hypothetical protein
MTLIRECENVLSELAGVPHKRYKEYCGAQEGAKFVDRARLPQTLALRFRRGFCIGFCPTLIEHLRPVSA